MTAEEINARYKKDQDKLIRHYGGITKNEDKQSDQKNSEPLIRT